MKDSAIISLAIIGSSGALFVVCALLMQDVRAKLVRLLVVEKHPLSVEISDWSVTGGRIPGYYDAIKKEFIWGARAKELLMVSGAAPLVQRAKAIYVLREAARTVGLVGMASLLWLAFFSA